MLRNTFELFYCHYFHFLQNFKTTVIYLKLSDYWSRISTRTVGNIVSPLLATDEIATVVTEFVVLAVCISGWWKNLHWLLLTISLHWRRREQFDTWSQLARLRRLKHPWFSLTALNGHLGFIAMNFKHWSVQWVGSLASAVSAFVRGALAGRVTGPTIEANVLEFTARAGFSCMKGPSSPFGKLWVKTIWWFFAVGTGRMGFVARGEHRLEPKFSMNLIPQEQIWVRLPWKPELLIVKMPVPAFGKDVANGFPIFH